MAGSLKGWMDPHGKFHRLSGNETHEEFARKLLVKPWNGNSLFQDESSTLYEKGWFRVVPYGSDTLSAANYRNKTLSDRQLSELRDMAIEAGMTKVILDNQSFFRTMWMDEEEMIPRVAKTMDGMTQASSKAGGDVRTRIARDLLSMAKEMVGFEFPSKDAMDDYLKSHPKADKSRHWVKDGKPKKKLQKQETEEKTEVSKTEEKTEVSGIKFKLPIGKLTKVQASGNLGNLKNWKAKIVLGNSAAKGKKKGDMDEVGYVGINLRGDDVVPIARGDEHQAGHELLYHLYKQGELKGSPEDYVTLYDGNNYPQYSGVDARTYASAIEKWLKYGGKNNAVLCTKEGGGDEEVRDYVTDMEEYVSVKGNVPYGSKKPSKAGGEILDHLEGALAGIKDNDRKSAFDHALAAMDRMWSFSNYVSDSYTDLESQKERIEKAFGDGDIETLKSTLKSVIRGLHLQMTGKPFRDPRALFGTGEESAKRVEKMNGNAGKMEDKSSGSSLSDSGKDIVESLERAANAIAGGEMLSSRSLWRNADEVSKALEPMKDDIDGLKFALERLTRALAEEDDKAVSEALFSFSGVKNTIHQHLRGLSKNGKEKDKNFGNVKTALSEFDRLGQI